MTNQEKPLPESGRETEGAVEEDEARVEEEAIFDELSRERDTSLFEKYSEKMEFSDDLKETVDKHLLWEADESKEEFVTTWAEDNRERIKGDKGVDIEEWDMPAKFKLCEEQGGFEKLKTDEQYQEQYDEIKNIDTLLYDLKKDNIPADSQILILNRLSHRVEKTENELDEAQKQGKEIEAIAKEGELRELLQATQEISQKFSKDDLEKTAEDEGLKSLIKSFGGKEDYTNDRFSKERDDYVDENLENELEKAEENGGYLQVLGYSMETKGFLRKKTIITNEKGNVVRTFARPEGAVQFLKIKGEGKIREDLKKQFEEEIGKDWEDLKTVEIEKAMRLEVKNFAHSPEKAEKGIEFLYQEARQKLIQEFKEKELQKDFKDEKKEKSERKKEKDIESKEDKKEAGESVEKFTKDLLEGEGPFKNLEGRWATDENEIRKFCDSIGLSTEALDPVEGEMRKKGMVYEKRKGIGLIAFFIELFFQLMQAVAKEEEKKIKE